MPIHFDLADLQAFTAVAELGNFRRAAEQVHISQPAFSRRIDKLETALGVRLLDRTTRHVELTAVGRDFARKARLVLDDLDAALLGIGEVAATRMGKVTLACVPSAAYYFLPQVIRQYHEAYPNIRVHIVDAGANEVLAAVARGEADFGINFMGSGEAELEFRTLLEESFVAACRKDHPLAQRASARWADLRAYDFMTVGKGSGNRLLMDLALAGVPERPQAIYEAEHIQTLLGLVEAGLGVAAVPRLAMPAGDHPHLASVPLREPEITRSLGLIRRQGRTLSPAAHALYALFESLYPPPAAARRSSRSRRVEPHAPGSGTRGKASKAPGGAKR